MAAPVDIADVRAWANISPGSITDEQLQQVLDAEAALQAARCTVPDGDEPLPAELIQALYRRCAREVSTRSLPLGFLSDTSEFGPVRLPSYDAEIERLEGPHIVIAVA